MKDVLPGGDLRDYAAVARVDFHLGGDDVGEDEGTVLYDGGGRLIAGGLYAEHEHDRGIIPPAGQEAAVSATCLGTARPRGHPVHQP